MKILYGVPGEGMGHATRAKVILSHLSKNHDLRIVSSDNAYYFLKNIFPDKTYEIKGFQFSYRDGVVSKSKTSIDILRNAPENIVINFKKYKDLLDDFRPDIVISDFESFTYLFAKYHRLPIISIDNMQIIDRGKLDMQIPESEKTNYKIAKAVIKAKVPNCNQYLISSFFDIEVKKRNSVLVPPIIRREILEAKTEVGNHILIYQSSSNAEKIVNILQSLSGENFLLYGFNKEEKIGNVQLKQFSETEFIDNFRTAKAVLANGGYSFISEALFLKKPICVVPIKNQFEQYANAAYIQKLGYGAMLKDFELNGIKSFLTDIPKFRKALDRYAQKDNNMLFSVLDEKLVEYCKK
ncbi:MJ1255/VC2487 family glycosyltransferase [Aquimarina sp. SS2-1]|uniref:MJ1255/VC2487 family glycosyltransferase n=1 Tax=Aquimarina besae TaxID=3342247 RepID=UPI003670BE8E